MMSAFIRRASATERRTAGTMSLTVSRAARMLSRSHTIEPGVVAPMMPIRTPLRITIVSGATNGAPDAS